MKKGNICSRVIIYFFITILMIIYIFPLLYVLNTSLKTNKEFLVNAVAITKTFHVQNFVQAWNRANFGGYFWNSIFYTAVCTIVSTLLAVFLAFPLSRKYLKFSGVIYSFFLAGMFLPDGTIPQFQLLLNLGLYNTRLGYILGMIGAGGIPLLVFVAYLKSIPKDFDEAASIDGCGYFRYIFSILIPLMKPAIASMVILTAMGVWNDIVRAIIYLSDQDMFPITRGLFVFTGQYSSETTLQMAALVLMAAPLAVFYVFLQHYIIDGVVAGGVKA